MLIKIDLNVMDMFIEVKCLESFLLFDVLKISIIKAFANENLIFV